MADIKFLSLAGLTKYDSEIKKYIDALLDAANGDIDAVVALVETLIGDDENKSVRTIANEELAAQLIPENAKEALDTLQEIAAWIQAHPDDVATMNAAIAANTKAIEDEASRADTAEKANAKAISDEITRATTKEGELETAIGNEKTRAEGKEGELNTAIENEVTRAGNAESALSGRLDVIEGEGAGSVKKAQADAEATAAADATAKVNALKDTSVAQTKSTTDEAITLAVTGTVGAPVFALSHNFVAVTDAEIVGLFEEENA